MGVQRGQQDQEANGGELEKTVDEYRGARLEQNLLHAVAAITRFVAPGLLPPQIGRPTMFGPYKLIIRDVNSFIVRLQSYLRLVVVVVSREELHSIVSIIYYCMLANSRPILKYVFIM